MEDLDILRALQAKALSLTELVKKLGVSEVELSKKLYLLKEQHLIEKHPVISGGCKTCACLRTFVWRLTFAGRQRLIT